MVLRYGLVLLLACALPARAQVFVVRPDAPEVAPGADLHFSAFSTTTPLKPDHLDEPDDIRAGICTARRRIDAQLTPGGDAPVFRGTVRAAGTGTLILCGTRLAQLWANTPNGLQRGTRRTAGAAGGFVQESFAKALLNVSPDDASYALPLHDRLEIVPVTNPAQVHPGQTMVVSVTHRGQPVSAQVEATYDGFSDAPDTWASTARTSAEGIATLKVTAAGTWIVHARYEVSEQTEHYDRWIGDATLLFEVR
jgi:hypothetical protein